MIKTLSKAQKMEREKFRMNDLIDEAAGHGFLVRGTSIDQCGGNTLKDREGLRIMLEAVQQNSVEAVMVRDLAQISRNSYILLGVILAGPSAPTTMAKLLTAWPRKRASAKSTRICFATPLSVSCSPTRTSVSLQWRLRRVMPNPARHWQFIRRFTTSGRIPSAAR